MNKEKSIKEEAYKCSKCGLCQSVCPIYLGTKNEMFLPRGRYIVLNNFFNNKKPLSKKFIKELDICLNCNLCKDFCPSSINSAEIFTELKKTSKLFYIKLFLIFFISGLHNLFNKYKPKKNTGKNKVLYFEGCYNRYINPADRNASIKLIEANGFEVDKVISNCCGYPFFNSGDKKLFEKNLKKTESFDSSIIKYIICSCDSCFETLSKSNNKEFTSKLIRLDKFLEINNYKIPEEINVCCHKPVSRKEKYFFPPQIEIINRKGSCSLMENFFLIKHPKIAKQIINTVKYTDEELKGKKLITTCNIAKWGLSVIQKNEILSYSEAIIKK